ncbi:alpha/beta hydrolase [Streptomyces abikoensis]|uniref:alpha/beta hydrolase n=1 Tax=Streptomyces TaxID=1883 RepID=UPI00340F79BC
MTAFVLVSEAFTGGWIWQEAVAGLRSAGAEAHPVTLTGLGDRALPAGRGIDLETHIEDVARAIDGVDAPEVVLVGHGYGIHPVLGAAGRRTGRVARIVYLDSGLPQDGDAPLKVVPDPTVHELLAGREGADELVPAPALDGWGRWGSLDGVPQEALERLSRLAAPQPAGTFTQPLRLAEEVQGLPTTGVLCTANGSSIEMVEAFVRLGDPRLRALVDPRVSFFELPTGHWPMLSCPAELAEVLTRAAAGEGHRLSLDEQPQEATFLLNVPERPRERVGRVDLHLPDADGPRPVVVFVHGGPFPAGLRPTPRDSATFTGYGRYAASLGLVGVTVDHRLHDLADFGRAAEDVAAAVELVRADPRVDGERVALWFFSGGGLLSADWLSAPPSWLRCVAATYPVLAPMPNWPGTVPDRFRPAEAIQRAGRLPFVLTRVELERPEIAATVVGFLTAAEKCAAAVEIVDVPLAHHGFETLDHTEETRGAVERAMGAVLGHLGG